MTKIYNHNTNFFKEWTYENAWILGFLTADGCVYKNRLNILLALKDMCVLEHIRDKISPQSKIITRENINWFDNKKICYKCCLQIASKEICLDLSKYNIFPQKTGREQLPHFPNISIGYRYLSGLIDGDGSIQLYKRKNKYSGYGRVHIISANEKFLNDIIKYFDIKANIYNKQSKCYILSIGGKSQLKDLYYNLYSSGGFCLKRKKEKFDEIIKLYEN